MNIQWPGSYFFRDKFPPNFLIGSSSLISLPAQNQFTPCVFQGKEVAGGDGRETLEPEASFRTKSPDGLPGETASFTDLLKNLLNQTSLGLPSPPNSFLSEILKKAEKKQQNFFGIGGLLPTVTSDSVPLAQTDLPGSVEQIKLGGFPHSMKQSSGPDQEFPKISEGEIIGKMTLEKLSPIEFGSTDFLKEATQKQSSQPIPFAPSAPKLSNELSEDNSIEEISASTDLHPLVGKINLPETVGLVDQLVQKIKFSPKFENTTSQGESHDSWKEKLPMPFSIHPPQAVRASQFYESPRPEQPLQNVYVTEQVFNALSEQLDSIGKKSETELHLHLEPSELGGVQLVFRFSKDKITAQVQVDKEATCQLLEGQLPVLRQKLLDAGISLGSLNISLNQGGSDRQKENNPSGRLGLLSFGKEKRTEQLLGSVLPPRRSTNSLDMLI